MSTVLFLNADKKIPTKFIKEIKRILPKRQWHSVDFLEERVESIPNVTYYFDCMWTPFYDSLNSYTEKTEHYEEFKKVIRGIQETVRLLLDNGYSIWLSMAGIEGPFPDLNKRVKLTFEELNDDFSMEWLTVYEIEK